LAHGTPWDTDTYLYPDAPLPLMEKVAQSAADFIVLGHTHHQFDRVIGNRRIINPGSVGQPRDRKPGAAWSILDLDTGKVDHRREVYDIGAVSARAKRNDPDLPYNWTVLSRT
ncbi:MAG: metallophosphoesterase family protein, partial [Cypionkella sp.]